MVKKILKGTGDIPLKLAKTISEKVNYEWENGTFLEKVSPVTKDLLRFWDPEGSFSDLRNFNFHKGQWQAILNIIYAHEVLKIKNIMELYTSIYPELLEDMDLLDLKKGKHDHPKFCIKMATGTGKTWIMSAILIWQYLNAKHEEIESGLFSKNFLLIAPGIIVYERLLDAYLGKRREDNTRDFSKSDFKMFESLFCPPNYKNEIFGFIQNAVTQKNEISKKVTGEGMIAITNWHLLLMDKEKNEFNTALDDISQILKEILPITPGKSAGHDLNELDNNYLKGKEINFLKNLPNLVVFNDEAHHLGEDKKSDGTYEKKWQESLTEIMGKKGNKYIQFDFSATPYTVSGSGQKRARHFFPHIIVNFELIDAIQNGLVKTVAIDKRKEITALRLGPLEFSAEREGGTILLSEGQRVMLRAGLAKLKILEEGFSKLDSKKHPKMLIMCEDTSIVPLVTEFFKTEGLNEKDIMEVHSNKKGEIGEEEWEKIKQRLFEIDKHKNPKIIISVLMLREGFDVNNICVIVPLRSSSSYILLEQTIGRGLRLMWREPQYQESKKETREKLFLRKEEPNNYMDILSIIEHPAFIEYYDKNLSGVLTETKELPSVERVVGDIIKVNLKENYKEYDFFWPIIVHEKEEYLLKPELSLDKLEKFKIPLKELKPLIFTKGDKFFSEELTVKTRYGEYEVTSDIFTAKSYNSFIQKIVNIVSNIPVKLTSRTQKNFPTMQINNALVAEYIDNYIRNFLFGEEFDPLKDNNWRILILAQEQVVQHIVRNIGQSIYDFQNTLEVSNAKVIKRYFSEIEEIKIRENYSLDVAKCIYPKIAYPSNKGGFEKAFIEYIDTDGKVKAFLKINEHYHNFVNIMYVREDGILSHYFPDFIVKINNKIYLVETKAERDMNNINVKQKRFATIDQVDKINELNPKDRMNCEWKYVLLGENTFYSLRENGATTEEILEYAILTKARIKGTLGDYTGIKEY